MAKHQQPPESFFQKLKRKPGLTILELSIAIVIAGLVIGGIVIGHTIIVQDAYRKALVQIDQYNQAVNMFTTKYNGLPGDLQLEIAQQNGFITNGCDGKNMGSRNGDGMIQGGTPSTTYDQFHAETGLFWEDLGAAKLIDSSFPANGAPARDCSFTDTHPVTLDDGVYNVANFLPYARIGLKQFVYVYSYNGDNFFGLSAVTGTNAGKNSRTLMSTPTMPVSVAYDIDKKMDDGMPQSGNVLATQYLNANALSASPNSATPSTSNCYDTTSGNYDFSFNNGSGPNCALSFKMH